MSTSVRRAVVTAAATLLCALGASPALAQKDEPFSKPGLSDEMPGGQGAQKTPTPTPTRTSQPTPTATATRTPRPTPTPSPTATPRPGKKENLPDTGSDPLRTGLMGLTLLGFGFSLRLRVADEARRRRL